MFLPHSAEIRLALAVLILVLEVHTQRIRFEEDEPRRTPVPEPASCDANSVCVPIRECHSNRSLLDWKNNGVTCGPGSGTLRLVCCQKRNDQPVPSGLSQECGQAKPSQIYFLKKGGTIATEGQWPWMAAIRIRERTGIFTPWCTGFLIDRRHVISAAHSFSDTTPGNYIARIGRVNQDEADTYEFNRIVVPQGYTPGLFYNDIAVLTLTREVDFPGFNPVCLPDEILTNQDLVGFGTVVAAWGTDGPAGNILKEIRELRQMPVVSNADCNFVFQSKIPSFNRQFPKGINEGFICAGFPTGERDECGATAGGAPLMIQSRNRWFVVGIVSFGFSCGQPGIPGGYTRITEQMEWIFANTRD